MINKINSDKVIYVVRMEKPQSLKDEDDISETVYELVDPSDVDAVLQKGLVPTHCVFIDNHQDYHEETDIETIEKSGEVKGYFWQYNETITLLNLIELHYEALHNSRKRQLTWKNISHALQSQNSAVDAGTCQRKWRNLIRSYNAINHSGNAGKIVKFQFYNEVHDILSKRVSVKKLESKQNDMHNYAAKHKSEKAEESNIIYIHSNKKYSSNSTKRKHDDTNNEPNTSNYTGSPDHTPNDTEAEPEVVITYVEKKSRATQTASCITPTRISIKAGVRKRRGFSLLKYFTFQQQYLEMDRFMQRKRSKEHQEEMDAKERRFQEKISLKREQLELDKRKVELFEQYLNFKMQGKI